MSRSWILATVAAMVICGAQSFAVEPADDLKNLNAKQDKIISKLDEMMNRIITLDDRVWSLQQANSGNEKEIRDLKRQMETLRNDMNALRSQLSASGNTSMSSPLGSGNTNPMPPAGAGLGTLQVRNDYPTAMNVVVNGQTFEVLPNQTANIRVPAGTFKYRVLGVDTEDRTRTVTAGGTRYARIYPIMPSVTP
jgi:outer membrane murein-binding lipoprotein Lpp